MIIIIITTSLKKLAGEVHPGGQRVAVCKLKMGFAPFEELQTSYKALE